MAKQRIKREIDLENGSVNFTIVETGDVIKAEIDAIFGKDTMAGLKKLDKSGVLIRNVLHGLNGKVGDSAADPTIDPGKQLTATIEQLVAGTWAQRSSGGGGKSNMLAEALMRVTEKSKEEVDAKLESMTDDEKKALRKHGQVKAALDAIQAERARARSDASTAAVGEEDALDF